MDGNTPPPTEIKLRQKSRLMELAFPDGSRFELSYELLRVYSPSAEVRGHGPGQEVLQVGKCDVDISTLEPSGSYAVQPTFSDGHSTGIYPGTYCWEEPRNAVAGIPRAPRTAGRAASPAPPLRARPKSK